MACAALLCSLSPRTSRAIPHAQTKPATRAAQPSGSYLDFLDRHFSTERLVRDLRYFTSVPHVASSPRNNELARFVLDEWKACGLEDVHLAEYDVLLSFPERIRVEIVSPEKVALSLREDSYPQDPDTSRADVGLPYNAYSASGDITAPVVYANSGNPQDYDLLEARGIDLRGKIALVRYSEPYSYRGFKAQTAEKRGLAALLIYSDPKEDGAVRGPVFPDGPWGPISHIQRGGIPFDFIYPGDPLTPGWASVPGAKRLPLESSLTLPRITSVPLSARDALPILRLLDGPQAPKEWAGALLPAYRLGGGSPRVHIDVRMDNSVRRITDVIGCVRGSEEPEALVLLGNHRDAWVFGGLDPSSGTACLMEIARAFGEARKAGFRPRRSVWFASWDAEEFTLTGSTEWGEENRDRLAKGLVAYLNVDSSACGRNFSVSAVPSLSWTILAALRGVADPATGRTVFERWKSGPQVKGAIPASAGSGRVNPIGSGSDHTVFLNHICAPALDMTFDGDYGVYHSMYDDFYWMSHFGDPGMRYTEALDKIWARIAVDLASRPLVPLDYGTYALELKGYLEEWAKQFDPSKKGVARLLALAEEMRKAAAAIGPYLFEPGPPHGPGPKPDVTGIPGGSPGSALAAGRRAEANRLLIEVERCFSLETGIPGRTWFKHLVFGTRSTYAALLLPELTEAAEAKNAEGVRIAVAHLQTALERAILKLKEIDGFLAHSGPR
ncbi:MAG TPA: M28 family metallopeptidase [Terriglobales bacterium]|nr:M28 family metallopeptidase [Terriglobales bacterium]